MRVGDIVTFPDSLYWTKKPLFQVVEIDNDDYPRIFIKCISSGSRNFFGTKIEDFEIGDRFPVWPESLILVEVLAE